MPARNAVATEPSRFIGFSTHAQNVHFGIAPNIKIVNGSCRPDEYEAQPLRTPIEQQSKLPNYRLRELGPAASVVADIWNKWTSRCCSAGSVDLILGNCPFGGRFIFGTPP
jgi:hypothetical protein